MKKLASKDTLLEKKNIVLQEIVSPETYLGWTY